MTGGVVAKPLTRSRWPSLERLFGPSGAYSGCWCVFHRQTSSAFEMFLDARFEEVERRKQGRPLLRYTAGSAARAT